MNLILVIGLIFSALIRLFFILNGSDVADVQLLHKMGEVVLSGGNPYLTLTFNSYPPLGIYLEGAVLWLSNLLNIPFQVTTKIPPNIADLIIAVFLYKYLIKQRVKLLTASLWSLAYALNPISLLISSIHGQLDSITALLVLLAILKESPIIRGLLLGLAIAIKPNPAMLIPAFLFYQSTNNKQKINFLLLTAAPLALTLIPFVLTNFQQIVGSLLKYSGVYDFGFAAVFRGIYYSDNAALWLPMTGELLNSTKLLFLTGVIFLTILFAKSKNLALACLSIYLLFLSVYFGISAQYLLWILPLAIITQQKMLLTYSIAGLLALLGFYLFFGPDILFGQLAVAQPFQSKFMLLYFTGNLLLWLTTLLWLIKIIKTQLKEHFNPTHRKLINVSLALFVLSFLPTVWLLIKLVGEIT